MIHVTAHVKEGQIVPHQVAEYIEELSKLNGKDIEILIRPVTLRSQPQNRYYWGTLIYLLTNDLKSKGWRADDLDPFDYQGQLTKDHVHQYMRYKFLCADVFDASVEEVVSSEFRSTAGLSPGEFAEYIEAIRQWAIEALNLYIPDPNEVEHV